MPQHLIEVKFSLTVVEVMVQKLQIMPKSHITIAS